ncbi:hypothetical protein NC651_007523 [Populus alba x Populus x berolinensis]|nr:hypothetical protein NC651_007523 [Populus alba x Populus x berolinensis]
MKISLPFHFLLSFSPLFDSFLDRFVFQKVSTTLDFLERSIRRWMFNQMRRKEEDKKIHRSQLGNAYIILS